MRVIYHPAPGPAADGRLVAPEPIDLGSDIDFALEWIKLRLGLVEPSSDMSLTYTDEPLDAPVLAGGEIELKPVAELTHEDYHLAGQPVVWPGASADALAEPGDPLAESDWPPEL